jgi:putative ABC transport system permease protein
MEAMGPDFVLEDTLGDPSQGFPQRCRVIGVIENGHYSSLYNKIRPLLLYVGPGISPRRDTFRRIFVRVESLKVGAAVEFLEAAWKRIQPGRPFEYFFQDEALRDIYSREKRWSAIVRYAFLLSLLLACLGISGLTAMNLRRREKEIGIRKVLGAKVEQIIYLSLKEYLWLLLISNAAAWPVVYFVMNSILHGYPYRISLGAQYFVLAGAASCLIAVLTILGISVKASLSDPVTSIRYE